jgi:hypothetical protein
MAGPIAAATLKEWLRDDGEVAALDVREHGQYELMIHLLR